MAGKLFNMLFDADTVRLLTDIAKADDRSRSAVVRTLIKREAESRGLVGAGNAGSDGAR